MVLIAAILRLGPRLTATQRAKRRASKLFLSHLWEVWRQAEGLPTREPWIAQYGQGHTMIDPWEYIRREAKEKEAV